MNRLIFGVTHLCARTRELAQTPSPDPLALMPVRECLDLLERTLDQLGHALSPRPPLPGAPAATAEPSWLVGADERD
jgi:hypothetical protein